jgi:hypothetical protein
MSHVCFATVLERTEVRRRHLQCEAWTMESLWGLIESIGKDDGWETGSRIQSSQTHVIRMTPVAEMSSDDQLAFSRKNYPGTSWLSEDERVAAIVEAFRQGFHQLTRDLLQPSNLADDDWVRQTCDILTLPYPVGLPLADTGEFARFARAVAEHREPPAPDGA